MGSPASPFFGGLACDPIINGVASGAGATCPTYVADLAGLLAIVVHIMWASLQLIAAEFAAGFKINV